MAEQKIEARVSGRDLPVSTKQVIEISSMLRGRDVDQSKALLEAVIAKQRAVRFTRFHRDVGHKPGMGPGRYPVNACRVMLKLLQSLEANAAVKGMDTGHLYIRTIVANKGPRIWHSGRWRRRIMKRTHVDIVAAELDEALVVKKQERHTHRQTQAKRNRPSPQKTEGGQTGRAS